MIEYSSDKYVTATEIARILQISYGTCKNNVLSVLAECHLPGRRRPVYKLAEVEKLSKVRIVDKQVQPLTLVKHEVVRIEKNLCREAL